MLFKKSFSCTKVEEDEICPFHMISVSCADLHRAKDLAAEGVCVVDAQDEPQPQPEVRQATATLHFHSPFGFVKVRVLHFFTRRLGFVKVRT